MKSVWLVCSVIIFPIILATTGNILEFSNTPRSGVWEDAKQKWLCVFSADTGAFYINLLLVVASLRCQMEGGMKVDQNDNTEDEKLTQNNSVSKKRAFVPNDPFLSPIKRRKLVSEYKQRTPRKSPLKTPIKRKIRRLKCVNASCNVGFSTQRAKESHERFNCPFDIPNLSSPILNFSLHDGRDCRVCGLSFGAPRSRVRHEQNIHNISSTASFSLGSRKSNPSSRAPSPALSSSGLF